MSSRLCMRKLSLCTYLGMDRTAGESDEPKANRLGVVWQKQSKNNKGVSDAGKISVAGNSNKETTNRETWEYKRLNGYLIRHPSVNSETKDGCWRMKYRSDTYYLAVEKHLLFVVGWYKNMVGCGILRIFLFRRLLSGLRTAQWN